MGDDKGKGLRKHFKAFGLSEATVLALAPVLAQMLVFSYDSGYLSVFHLPLQFVEINLVRTFTVLASILGALAFLRSFSSLGFMAWLNMKPSIPAPIVRSLSRMFVVLLVYSIFLSVMLTYEVFGNVWFWIWTGIPVLGVAFLEFVFPLITQKNERTYAEKLRAQERVEGSIETLEDKFIGLMGQKLMLACIVVLLGILFAFGVGRRAAITRKSFYVVSTSPEVVVLWMTADRAVFAPFDRNTRKIEPAFGVFEVVGQNTPIFRLEEVGPLQIQDMQARSAPATPVPTLFSSPVLPP